MIHFAEINQVPPVYSMLQYIGRVATPKLVPSNCLRYFQAILIIGKGDWSQNLCEVLSKKINEKKNKGLETPGIFLNLNSLFLRFGI